MSENHYWLLPEGISEALPEDAARLEVLRRRLIDLYRSWGYQLVMPPLVEFMESLSTGTGKQLDIQTFKLTDQESGRLMGVRADITPQVARIDAHRMRADYPNRLCYVGPVLRTRSNHATGGSRSPLQIGAELFGHAGLDSDVEVISLAIETLQQCLHEGATQNIILDLGHVGIFSEIVTFLGLNHAEQDTLTNILQRKSIPDLSVWIEQQGFSNKQAEIIKALPELNGSVDVIAQAETLLGTHVSDILPVLSNIRALVQRLEQMFPEITINLDFGELRGYTYHTGIVFQLYLPGMQRELIRGGRYDGIGEAFGHARPATGFSADLRFLGNLCKNQKEIFEGKKIIAPAVSDTNLDRVMKELREQGNIVIRQLQQKQVVQLEVVEDLSCDYQLVSSGNDWVVEKIS